MYDAQRVGIYTDGTPTFAMIDEHGKELFYGPEDEIRRMVLVANHAATAALRDVRGEVECKP